METIYLSLRAQVAVGTFFMKSPLYTIYLSLCTQTAGPNHHRGTHYISLNLNLFQTYPLPARLPGYLIKYKQISDISVTAAGLLGQLDPNIHILYLSVTRTSTLCISIFFFYSDLSVTSTSTWASRLASTTQSSRQSTGRQAVWDSAGTVAREPSVASKTWLV